MADIFEEVEEGLRQDRLSVLWKRYGILAYLGAALLIGGVGLNEYLQVRSAQTVESNAARLEAALTEVDARNYDNAAQQLSALVDDDIAPSTVAAHYLAGVRLDGNGDAVAAANVLQSAVDTAEDPTQKLALIKAAYLKADTMTRDELTGFLSPLSEDDGPFGALATELIAAKALQEGDIEFARREFNLLRLAQSVPPGVMLRAEQALETLPPISADISLPVEDATESAEPESVTSDSSASDSSESTPVDTAETPEPTGEADTADDTEETPE
nr:hypothetical protein [Hyphomonas sp. Mor2]